MFDNGSIECSWSAGHMMTFPKNIFFKFFPVEKFMQTVLMKTLKYYCRKVDMTSNKINEREYSFNISGLKGDDILIAYRFGGGLEKILQMKGHRDINIFVNNKDVNGYEYTQFEVKWV